MILVDAGPLIALIDRADAEHALSLAIASQLAGGLVTTWPVIAEVMHILGARIGWAGQEQVWGMMLSGGVRVKTIEHQSMPRVHALMKKYRDTPMDLGDASLVELGERLAIRRVFTFDSDFLVYRFKDRLPFALQNL